MQEVAGRLGGCRQVGWLEEVGAWRGEGEGGEWVGGWVGAWVGGIGGGGRVVAPAVYVQHAQPPTYISPKFPSVPFVTLAHLETHHELAGGALAAVEQAGPLETDVDIIEVKVLPLGLALLQQGRQLKHVVPGARAALLDLNLLKLVGLLVERTSAGGLGQVLQAAVLANAIGEGQGGGGGCGGRRDRRGRSEYASCEAARVSAGPRAAGLAVQALARLHCRLLIVVTSLGLFCPCECNHDSTSMVLKIKLSARNQRSQDTDWSATLVIISGWSLVVLGCQVTRYCRVNVLP